MSGTNPSTVKVTLRNPVNKSDTLDYYIIPNQTQLAQDWVIALKKLLMSDTPLEKNFCFMGFPKTARSLEYLCDQLNHFIETINKFDFEKHGLEYYLIEDWFHPDVVRFSDNYPIEWHTMADPCNSQRPQIGLQPKHSVLNRLHNHFEVLQGTVNNLSEYYRVADYETKYAIRQLNNICHEMENLILSQRKFRVLPNWIRPSQITTFLHAERYKLSDEHRQGFTTNGYDRKFGHVYMHWAQIGKTLFEVWRDEGASKLTDAICEAITHLEYYSGEFDVEWGKNVTMEDNHPWHIEEQRQFREWLLDNGLDPNDSRLSLGYLPVGEIDLVASFGTKDMMEIWDKLSNHLDIYAIEVDGVSAVFDYCWGDDDYKQQQIDMMQPGYDFSSRR
jgi:hypothetical protein